MEMIIYGIIGIAVGALLTYFAMRLLNVRSGQQQLEKIAYLDKQAGILEERISSLGSEKELLQEKLEQAETRTLSLNTSLTTAQVENKNLKEKFEDYKKEVEDLRKKFELEFENVASKILKQNTEDFTARNQKNIGEILNPLKEKIELFEKKVADTYEKGLKDQTDLKAELKKLHELNTRISEEASNLTKALKADTKKQGNWGELILEKVLERSGLVKGQEYYTQYTDRNENGELIRPDVVVNLPDDKHIIIDAKVSLLAYEQYVNADDEDERQKHLKAHTDSVREHVRALGEKNYQQASKLDVPDFVLLFMPIESAFSAAIQQDAGLFNYAWDKKIVLVSPTTLLATLKTVESIWKHEKQTQNALEIARQGGNLYDKFVLFLEDLERIGKQLGQTQRTYEDAHKKLSSGSGNLIKRMENLKKLGAKASKSIPSQLLPEQENSSTEE
jgi:DNA recombination protein RmuC